MSLLTDFKMIELPDALVLGSDLIEITIKDKGIVALDPNALGMMKKVLLVSLAVSLMSGTRRDTYHEILSSACKIIAEDSEI